MPFESALFFYIDSRLFALCVMRSGLVMKCIIVVENIEAVVSESKIKNCMIEVVKFSLDSVA